MYFLSHLKAIILFIVFLLIGISTAYTHPVTFEGGTAISMMSQPGVKLWHANYSLSSSIAMGADYMRLGATGETHIGLARLNILAKRWLGRGSQGNLYLLTGAGVANGLHQKIENQLRGTWMVGFQADYETQRIYTALVGRALGDQSPSLQSLSYHSFYRLGFAPYVARSNELQAWLVGQFTQHSARKGLPSFTLLMRVFHRSALWEIGADLEGHPWIHLMAHF